MFSKYPIEFSENESIRKFWPTSGNIPQELSSTKVTMLVAGCQIFYHKHRKGVHLLRTEKLSSILNDENNVIFLLSGRPTKSLLCLLI